MQNNKPANAAASYLKPDPERRERQDRRQRVFYSLVYGSFRPRRRHARRSGEPKLGHLDWYQPRWFAVALGIVSLSCADAFLTLFLLARGAYEVNPVMSSLIGDSALAFALVKFSLTAGGVLVLTLMSRMRAFGRIPVGLILYLALGGYAILIVYELTLLQKTSFSP